MASKTLTDAFERAKKDFISQFPNGTPANFEEFTTINDVYKAAEEIQLSQAKTRTTRNLRKIQPFLECLRHYAEVIETFVTVKPNILALIWGPIKFLLLTSSTYIQSFDKLVDAMSQISLSLPAFEKYAEVFPGSQPFHQVLCLFYQDILDFYATVLAFFKHKRWSVFFESLWPKSAGRIRVITENIEKHRILMDGSITLAHVVEAHTARQQAFQEFERQHEFRQRQDLEAVKSSLGPVLYDQELQRLKACRVVRSGDWLLDQEEYTHWIDPWDKTARLLWLQGIPGAGKTFLSSSIVESLASRGDSMVFAYLKYQSRESISLLQLLHSFIWQMALDHKELQSPLILAHQENYRRLNSDVSFLEGLLSQFLDSMPITFIIIDGLDEMPQTERLQIMGMTFDIMQKCNVKILISSRPEDDISRALPERVPSLRVHDFNKHDIEVYVNNRASSLVSDVGNFELDLAQRISDLMKKIAVKAEGMLLYARLICDSIGLLGDFDSIKEAVEDLPNGLNEAYERILSRITEGLEKRQSEEARQILSLITCSVVPLSKNEIQLAIYTAQGSDPSRGCKGLFLNILQRCGPVIEEIDGYFRFVHFSAREYLLSPQSKHYLTEPAAHACVASIGVKYLNSACINVDIDDYTFSLSIRSGAFVLLDYICNHWLHHVGKVGEQGYQRLRKDINRLTDTRANPSFVEEVTVSESQDEDTSDRLGSIEEKIQHNLDRVHAFSKKRYRELNLENYEDWRHMDPLTLSETEARFHRSLESMLCEKNNHEPDCACQELRYLYGSSIYKCGMPGCTWYRVGFNTKTKRDEHVQRHTRPFKCQNPGCPFVYLGFVRKIDLESHSAKAHDQNLPIYTRGWTKASSQGGLKEILIDAVKENDLSAIKESKVKGAELILTLLLTAYQERSSDAIIKHLVRRMWRDINTLPPLVDESSLLQLMEKVFEASIEYGSCDVFRTSSGFLRHYYFGLFEIWLVSVHMGGYKNWLAAEERMLRLIGGTRGADLIGIVSEIINVRSSARELERRNICLFTAVIPKEPDAQAEILALECFKALGPTNPSFWDN